jgi:hypothetical protein
MQVEKTKLSTNGNTGRIVTLASKNIENNRLIKVSTSQNSSYVEMISALIGSNATFALTTTGRIVDVCNFVVYHSDTEQSWANQEQVMIFDNTYEDYKAFRVVERRFARLFDSRPLLTFRDIAELFAAYRRVVISRRVMGSATIVTANYVSDFLQRWLDEGFNADVLSR